MKIIICLLVALALAQPSFAADVTVVQTMINVATTSTVVSSRDTRLMLILTNVSDAVVSCKFGAPAVPGQGIILNPQPSAGQAGGAVLFDVVVPTGPLNCVHGGAGTKAVSLVEG